MSYLLHAKKRRKNPIKKILLVLVLCLIAGFFAKGLIVKSITGLAWTFERVVAFILPGGFRTNNEIVAENEKLRNTVVELTALNADRNVLKEENTSLKMELGRRTGSTTAKFTPEVFAIIKERPGDTPFDTFILDTGTDEGVVVEDSVFYGNLVIGKIVEVGSNYAKAQLFSSPGNIFSGIVSGTDIKIDAKGIGGGMFESFVPESTPVEVGDALILPSITSKVFGLIQEIEIRKEEGFKRLLFTLPVNPNQIYSVTISK